LTRAAGVTLLLASALLLGFGASPASAHAVLERTIPANGSTVDVVPASVSLVFDEAPEVKFSTIHVTGPDGQRRDNGPVTLSTATVTEHMAGSRPAGRYTVDWRVISDDGHPVSGQFTFTATSAGPQVVSRSVADAPKAKSSNTAAIVIGIVAALVVIAGLAAFISRRQRRPAMHE
jgi:hypothetical protein